MVGNDVSHIFKALSHDIRVEILDILKNGPKSTGELDNHFENVSRYAVMKHLTILYEANLILYRKHGRLRMNFINVAPLQMIYERWVSKYQGNFATSILTLKNNLEGSLNDMEKGYTHDSFQIEQEYMIKASKEKVFTSLTKDINNWWGYRLCGEGSIFSLEPKVGGQFLESGKNGDGAHWGTITYIKPNAEIRLHGLLGMQGAVTSSYSYVLEEQGEATLLKLSHSAVGLLDPNWENAHAGGWEELLGSFLKSYVETSQ
ncbi:SRPBCC domain-containing protein [Rossellomorea sp. BNER]|uniref:SRPBCC domain-containing protein n=1 Tax=Rossellomorea sp. BNER TaxID=2962031 RepID=UPI003AF28F86|nr:helix-turn-helix domain-containing protein [Rossellomorea sp. BNER]